MKQPIENTIVRPRIKVCGMRESANIEALLQLQIDYIGFIFYPPSKRFVAERPLLSVHSNAKRVGVFVNATLKEIAQYQQEFDLEIAQLHGQESPTFCQQVQQLGLQTIKAFAVDEHFDFSQTQIYSPFCDYFLFDTKGKHPGGNGVQFDWSLLDQYTGSTPFFLSGGLSPGMSDSLLNFQHPQLFALDLNSRFEKAPALKDIDLLAHFLQRFHIAE
ncbi:MAG: phosphoribosylanthranilate isomerase [Bacteroidota bacterium]